MDRAGKQHGFLLSDGNFVPIDHPGALSTWAYGINSTGDIVGYHIDTAGLPGGGVLGVSFDFPFSVANSVWDMSARGELVGYYTDAAKKVHGFLLRLDDSAMTFSANPHLGLNGSFVFTSIDYPGATATFAQGINTDEDVVGFYVDSAKKTHAFFLQLRRHHRE
ncbi:MAG: extracellular repeat protein family [Bryobacterales bacterium]|nr:extracellular repeat protein family [Bryobacterales bacterium]